MLESSCTSGQVANAEVQKLKCGSGKKSHLTVFSALASECGQTHTITYGERANHVVSVLLMFS